jgi:hypothetical protein
LKTSQIGAAVFQKLGADLKICEITDQKSFGPIKKPLVLNGKELIISIYY